MFYIEIINDADILNLEISQHKDIQVAYNVTQKKELDNFCKVKMVVKRFNC